MSWVIYLFGSELAFFIGVGLDPARIRVRLDLCQLDDAELRAKYRDLSRETLGPERAAMLEHCVDDLERDPGALRRLVEIVLNRVD